MSITAAAAPPGRAAPPSSHPAHPAGAPDAPLADARTEVPLDQVVFRRVRGAAGLARIAHLREAIALPPGLRDAPAFARLEKKGTSRA